MRNAALFVLAVVLTLSLAAGDALAQRGRGGGGRGGGGGGGGSRPSGGSFGRGPSMSRPSPSRPSTRPSVPSRPSTRPSAPSRPSTLPSTRPGTPSRPNTLPSTRPGGPSRPGGGRPTRPSTGPGLGGGQRPATRPGERPSPGDLQGFLGLPKQRPSTLPALGGRPGGRPGTRPRPGDRPINVNRPQINQRIHLRYPSVATRPFTPGWWGRHPAHLPARPWHPWFRPRWHSRPHYWWRWATASALTGWIVWGWSTPVYYVYGSGGNVYYQNDVVYVDGQPYCSAEDYYEQAETIAAAVPEIDEAQADQVEWLPLGVFALTKEGINESNFLLQLAVTKEGVIGGTVVNEGTGSVRPVEGMVDKETQRAAWKFVDGKNTEVVMETGIYGLTEDECTALVHYGPDQTQTIVLVRLDQPDDPAGAAPQAQPAP